MGERITSGDFTLYGIVFFSRWHAIVVDGHDVEAICRAFHEAKTTKGKPTALLAKTYKGHGVTAVSDKENWHGKALGEHSANAVKEIQERIVEKGPHGLNPQPVEDKVPDLPSGPPKLAKSPNYTKGQKVTSYSKNITLIDIYPRLPLASLTEQPWLVSAKAIVASSPWTATRKIQHIRSPSKKLIRIATSNVSSPNRI